MKLKQNFFLKFLAFLLALVFFGAAGAMTVYQVVNFNVIWRNDDPVHGYVNRQLCWQASQDIQELVNRRKIENPDSNTRRRLETLESAYAAENTNLRWAVWYEDQILYGSDSQWVSGQTEVLVYNFQVEIDGKTQPGGVHLWLDPDLPVYDAYKEAYVTLVFWQTHRLEAVIVTAAAVLLGILCTVYLCVTCGHKKGREGIYLNWFHHVPGDLLLAIWVVGFAMLGVGLSESFYVYNFYNWEFRWSLILATACIVGMVFLVISFLVTFVARCKGRAVLRHTVIVWICIRLWRMCKAVAAAIPLIWKTALMGGAYLLYSAIIAGNIRWIGAFWVIVWIILTVQAVLYLCWWACNWKKVRRGTHEIISGSVGHQIDSSKMPSDLREHAGELNNLGHAIGAAVEERMRSEHFKAELITNVSHDLKTPLTSIISYVDLLKKEDIDNPRAREYIEVLDRKSQRLKKLTEDLVEASKASTGALNVSCERLDLVQLTDQTLAEYEDRLAQHRLTVVRTVPPEPVWVMADGRHLWRVLDNLLSNCAKYALEGTRVYVEVQKLPACARLSVKNISREELNVPAEQLTERFVRGDESRTLEGSGLGLSIASSLTDLQQGSFEITVDGDLFKVTVTLPLAE